jgi:hypothetical protein
VVISAFAFTALPFVPADQDRYPGCGLFVLGKLKEARASLAMMPAIMMGSRERTTRN